MLDRLLAINPLDTPVLFASALLVSKIVELMVIMPLETIKFRLQLLPKDDYKTIVAISPIPYYGVWDCIFRMWTEEGSASFPLAAFYRGFKFRLISQLITSMLRFISINPTESVVY
jgi:hypothetical protein